MKSIPNELHHHPTNLDFTYFQRFHSSFRKPPLPQRCPASHRERGTGGGGERWGGTCTPGEICEVCATRNATRTPWKFPRTILLCHLKKGAYLPKMKVSHLPTTCIFSQALAVGFTRCMSKCKNLVLGSQWLMDFFGVSCTNPM